jgi:hypothetical protein
VISVREKNSGYEIRGKNGDRNTKEKKKLNDR